MADAFLLHTAVRICVEAHAGQSDKAGEPYVFHCFRVADAVEGDDAKAVALLHDVVEDHGWYPIDSCAPLGLPVNVVNALIAITRRKEEGEMYGTYIGRVALNPLATRVKLADLRDNLRPERISALPPEQAASLSRRYHAAYARLSRSTP